jgi:hypothetical protein
MSNLNTVETSAIDPSAFIASVEADLNSLEQDAAVAPIQDEVVEPIQDEVVEPVKAKAKKASKAKTAPAKEVAQAEVVEVAAAHVPGVIRDLVGAVAPKDLKKKEKKIADEFAARIAFENAQPGLSGKMIPNLEAAQKKMANPGTAAIFCAIDIDPAFINREISAGSKFNVYGLQKVNDLVTGIGAGIIQNAINRAVLISMFNFKKAGVAFTGEAALAAVSDKIKVDKAIAKHLTRYTVSANTASTQKSSTMNALETLGIVSSNKLRGNAEVFSLTDTPQTRRLEEALMAIAA